MNPGWSLAIYAAVVVALVAAMVGVSYVLGERHVERATTQPYESGIAPTGGGRLRFSVGFYVVAVAFVVFDLEAVFLFAWAIAAPDVGWAGYAEAMIFIGVLVCALIYMWRRHAFDWGLRSLAAERR
jgi:NADH-quinone oxidoreductase subunit A